MSEWDNDNGFFRYKRNTHQLHDQDQQHQYQQSSNKVSESDIEKERRVAEYWKNEPTNKNNYEPTAILGQTKKTGRRFSIYEISNP